MLSPATIQEQTLKSLPSIKPTALAANKTPEKSALLSCNVHFVYPQILFFVFFFLTKKFLTFE